MSKLRFGLIGCGDFGREFARYVLEVADIVALCDLQEASTRAVNQAYALQARCYTDHRAMIDAGGLDAVVITAANFAHREITCDSAEAGLHVFCEKAMARTVPECWEMVRVCQRRGVKLMIGHKRRLRPPWARMIELTRADALLGEPLAITVTQYADMRPYGYRGTWWSKSELGGGAYHILGVHVIDWFRAMCGDARLVSAMFGPKLDSSYEFREISHATFAFQGGAVASLCSSMTYPIHRFREAQGPLAQCRRGGFKMTPFLDHIDLYWQTLDDERARHERFDDLGFDHAFRLEISDFVRWVSEDRAPCLTWVEGLRCVELMEAAYKSAQRDGQPVSLPLYPELE